MPIESAQLDRFYLNSFIAAAALTLLGVAHNALAGFAFAKMRFVGRTVLFWLALSTMMLPIQVFFIFAYVIVEKLGYVDSLRALIIPFIASGFGIYYMRQAIKGVPDCAHRGRAPGRHGRLRALLDGRAPQRVVVDGGAGHLHLHVQLEQLLLAPDRDRLGRSTRPCPSRWRTCRRGCTPTTWPVQMAAATIMTLPLIVVFLDRAARLRARHHAHGDQGVDHALDDSWFCLVLVCGTVIAVSPCRITCPAGADHGRRGGQASCGRSPSRCGACPSRTGCSKTGTRAASSATRAGRNRRLPAPRRRCNMKYNAWHALRRTAPR